MTRALLAFLVLAVAFDGHAAEREVVLPFESDAEIEPANHIDDLVLASLRDREIEPANLCSDVVFFRRVHLDVIGTLPEPKDLREFLEDDRPDKRALLIDDLLERDEFADYWSMKWCDVLRVKAEFPINLWPNGVQAYHRWIRDSISENRPYDEFAYELLTASGSNFRVPAVNFYRAIQGDKPSSIAEAASLTFMGVRMSTWPEDRREGLAAFFSRIAFKGTAEWKEQIVCMDPAPAEALDAVFPDGRKVRIRPDEDPRRVFADWLVEPRNPWFTRNIVNRIWAWLLGRGIIHEPDDIRPDNRPVNRELLVYLEKELLDADYDLRHVYRLILNSRTYQQSSIPQSDHPDAEAMFAHYMVRRLDAEVLIDALCWIGGPGERYTSAIPEPFTFVPERQRSITLADGSITSQFLEMFGRPSRDTGLESERSTKPTASQRLHMLNSTHVQRKIQQSQRLRGLLRGAGGNRRRAIRWMYVMLLTRYPTEAELAAAEEYCAAPGRNAAQNANDLAWALINTKEFLYRH